MKPITGIGVLSSLGKNVFECTLHVYVRYSIICLWWALLQPNTRDTSFGLSGALCYWSNAKREICASKFAKVWNIQIILAQVCCAMLTFFSAFNLTCEHDRIVWLWQIYQQKLEHNEIYEISFAYNHLKIWIIVFCGTPHWSHIFL